MWIGTLGMFKSLRGAKSADPLKTLSAKIWNFATASELVVRKSKKFKPEVFLLALIQAANSGNASYNEIASKMVEIDEQCDLSAVAIWKRISTKALALERFLGMCITHLCSIPVMDSFCKKSPFTRILTEDSSFVKMLKSCAELFPAHGNKHGSTAGVKLNLIFDLLTGNPLNLSTHGGTEQDRTIGKDMLDFVRKGDLILRDMGYFCVSIFSEIEAMAAHWLSRLPVSVKAYTESGVALETILKRAKSNIVDRQMLLTDKQKPARLIAVRKSKEQADQAVAKLREEATKKGNTPDKAALERARWHILVSSVNKATMSARDLGKLYAQRWQIEIIFKAWKQSSQLGKSLKKRSSYQHLLGIFLSEVFRLTLSLCCYSRLLASRLPDMECLSIYKLNCWLTMRINKSANLTKITWKLPKSRHISGQKKSDKSQVYKLLELLS